MTKRWFQFMLFVGAVTAGTTLFAYQGNGHGKGNRHNDQGARREERDDDDRWERRGDYEYRTYGQHDGVPPGWSRGRKTGWGNCGLPPGQAKKYGCQSYRYSGRDYYYYRDDGGRIVVRRPSIHIHGSIDVH